jgi:hypothetical protein
MKNGLQAASVLFIHLHALLTIVAIAVVEIVAVLAHIRVACLAVVHRPRFSQLVAA